MRVGGGGPVTQKPPHRLQKKVREIESRRLIVGDLLGALRLI